MNAPPRRRRQRRSLLRAISPAIRTATGVVCLESRRRALRAATYPGPLLVGDLLPLHEKTREPSHILSVRAPHHLSRHSGTNSGFLLAQFPVEIPCSTAFAMSTLVESGGPKAHADRVPDVYLRHDGYPPRVALSLRVDDAISSTASGIPAPGFTHDVVAREQIGH